jgi:SAM-dependent methyltransferase
VWSAPRLDWRKYVRAFPPNASAESATELVLLSGFPVVARAYYACSNAHRRLQCTPAEDSGRDENLRLLPTSLTPDSGASQSVRGQLKSRLRDFWNSNDSYLDNPAQEVSIEGSLRVRAASFVPLGSDILDVACGLGTNSACLEARGRYFGTDVSVNFLEHPAGENLRLVCSDGEALPFATKAFDAVISTYALEHCVEPVRVLREMQRVTRRGGRIILLGPAWDFPFWYPNALRSKSGSIPWRVGYTARRAGGQVRAMLGGASPFAIIDEPDALTQPYVYDSDAVYVVWSYEVIRQMKEWGCRLICGEADTPLLGENALVRFGKLSLMKLPAYRYAGSTILLVFEKG